MIIALLFSAAAAFTANQTHIIRDMLERCHPHAFSAFVDAIMPDNLAFTQTNNNVVFIDGQRFIGAPNTLANVVLHECAHTNGAVHDTSPVPGSIMSYAVRLAADGHVIEDAGIWPNVKIPP